VNGGKNQADITDGTAMTFLDTTFLVDFFRGEEAAIVTMKKMENSPLYTSEINVFELVEGAYIGNRPVGQHLEKIFAVLSLLTVLPFDRKAALKAGMISGSLMKEGTKVGEADCLIAGVALANGISAVVTRNKKDFERMKEIKVIAY